MHEEKIVTSFPQHRHWAATTLAGCGNSTEEAAAPAVTDVSEAEEEVEAEEPEEEEPAVEEETREGMYRSEMTNEWSMIVSRVSAR